MQGESVNGIGGGGDYASEYHSGPSPTCFVIMPITTPIESVQTYGGDPQHFEHVLDYLFEPALVRAGFEMIRPSVLNSEVIHAEIIRNLETANLVLCDISGLNANVFFELGIRVALDRPVALVRDSTTTSIPFDNAPISCYTYDASITAWSLKTDVGKLTEFITKAGAQDRNAMWKHFGITQRASVPSGGDPVQDKLDLILAQMQRQADSDLHENRVTRAPLFTTSTLPSEIMNNLDPSEREVFQLSADGKTVVEIARILSMPEGWVDRTKRRIFDKIIRSINANVTQDNERDRNLESWINKLFRHDD